jgi:hypothetical protein
VAVDRSYVGHICCTCVGAGEGGRSEAAAAGQAVSLTAVNFIFCNASMPVFDAWLSLSLIPFFPVEGLLCPSPIAAAQLVQFNPFHLFFVSAL